MPIRKMDRSDLAAITVVAQSLDNQWLPADLAHGISDTNGFVQLGGQRSDRIRRELMGSLLTSEQIVVNRANLQNNEVFREILRSPEESQGLRDAMATGSMVVFLYDEDSLDGAPKFHSDDDHLGRLRKFVADADVPCVRFDWKSDDTNRSIIKKNLDRRFHGFVHSISDIDKGLLRKSLNIPDDLKNEFNSRLMALSDFAHEISRVPDDEARYITRSNVYENFVSPPNKKHDDGYIDPKKPFAREIKALVDLKYNCNLPDALSGYAITSAGNIDRTVLQEERGPELANLDVFSQSDEGALVDILCAGAFDEFTTFNSFTFLEALSMNEVLLLKKFPGWSEYAELVKRILPTNNHGLLANHAIFDDANLRALGKAHAAIMTGAASFVESAKAREEVAGWWEIGVSLVGAGIHIASERFGTGAIELPENEVRLFADAATPILIELTWNTTDKMGRKQAVRKYPLLKKRAEDPLGLFRRTREKIEAYKRRRSGISLKPETDISFRANDRRNTLNFPE